jgi:hypothetical protein
VNNEQLYPAASFAAQVLSFIDASPKPLAEQFRRRVHGAFKNPDDMRGLRLELMAATHFLRRGRQVSWPEMTGEGNFDLLVSDVGPDGLEVECKSISVDKGRRIHKRESLDFLKVGLGGGISSHTRRQPNHTACGWRRRKRLRHGSGRMAFRNG